MKFVSIDGYSNYLISSCGIVKSKDRIVEAKGSGTRLESGRVMASNIGGRGYFQVTMVSDLGKRKTLTLHRLIAKSFIPNTLDLEQINHIDGVKTNNSISNLEWCTPTQNLQHARDTGLRRRSLKLTEDDVLSIRKMSENGESRRDIASMYSVSVPAICGIINRRYWRNI